MKAASVTQQLSNSLMHVHNFFAIASARRVPEELKNGGAKCHTSVICNGTCTTIPMKDEQNAITRQEPLSSKRVEFRFIRARFSHYAI